MKRIRFAVLLMSLICLFISFSSIHAKSEDIFAEIYQDEKLDSEFTKIAWDQKNTYVVVGYYLNESYSRDFPVVYISNDSGGSWDHIRLPFGKRPEGNYVLNAKSLFWDGQRFIFVDGSGTILASDENGYNWEVVLEPTLEIAYFWDSMYMVDGKYVGFANPYVLEQKDPIIRSMRGAVIVESDDLKNWEVVKPEIPEGINATPWYINHTLAANDEITIMGGDHSRFVYKKDGQWVEKPFDSEHPVYNTTEEEKRLHYEHYGTIDHIIWDGEEFILSLNPHGGYFENEREMSIIYASEDGVTWDKVSTISDFRVDILKHTDLGSIIFGLNYPTRFIGYSTDQREWKFTILPEEIIINDLLWNGEEIIAVGSSVFHITIPPELYYHDFEEGRYWSGDLLWAIENGLVSGYKEKGKKLIKPSKNLTEAEAITILYRYFEPDEITSTKPKTNWWASVPYQLANKDGLDTTASYQDQNGSNDVITRGKMAQLLASKHFGKRISEKEAVQFMYDANITSGYPDQEGHIPKTYESYGADKVLERAHIVTFIKRYHDNLNKIKSLHY